MYELLDRLPLGIQLAIGAVVGVAAFMLWVAGRKSTAGDNASEDETRERIEKLQERLLDERLARMESTLQVVIASARQGIMNELNQSLGEMGSRVAELHTRVERLAARIHHHNNNKE